jgi:signal transduction histidine kinase
VNPSRTQTPRPTGRARGRDLAWSGGLAWQAGVAAAGLGVELLVWGGARDLRFGAQELPAAFAPLVATAVFATLIVRRQWPVQVFVVQWIYAVTGALLIPEYEPFAGLLIALHAVAERCRPGISRSLLAVSFVPLGINSYNGAAGRLHTSTSLGASMAATGLLYAVLFLGVWGVGRLAYAADAKSRRAREAQLADAASALRHERLRLARELHDIVAHAVTAMIWHAAGAKTLVSPDDTNSRDAFAGIEKSGAQAMDELHRMLSLLRSVDPDVDYVKEPGLRDVPSLVSASRRSGLDVELTVEGTPAPIDASVDLAAYRIIQESLTNTAKHGGEGAAARVQLSWTPERLLISVRDQAGAAPHKRLVRSPKSSGYGLLGLVERVSLVGGEMVFASVSGGFLVRAELPTTKAHQVSGALAGHRLEEP